jgi:hypothetical protein
MLPRSRLALRQRTQGTSSALHLHWSKVERWREWARNSEACRLLGNDRAAQYGTIENIVLAANCRKGGLGGEPRQNFEQLCEISLMDMMLPTRDGLQVRLGWNHTCCGFYSEMPFGIA